MEHLSQPFASPPLSACPQRYRTPSAPPATDGEQYRTNLQGCSSLLLKFQPLQVIRNRPARPSCNLRRGHRFFSQRRLFLYIETLPLAASFFRRRPRKPRSLFERASPSFAALALELLPFTTKRQAEDREFERGGCILVALSTALYPSSEAAGRQRP
ncbi:hypothetical protein BCR35DRAFT_88644 [Leucosporidium creatinivorum]|uniref:Uncharacterized protein n=1 Tax=Leucosporidium creatinivorum TaxID=106004 RepID=A0A1Y2FAL1_9BASI|nr:hypothetical protein BCR35DRAFT_88644 [Leucosporidium creatinivorum]